MAYKLERQDSLFPAVPEWANGCRNGAHDMTKTPVISETDVASLVIQEEDVLILVIDGRKRVDKTSRIDLCATDDTRDQIQQVNPTCIGEAISAGSMAALSPRAAAPTAHGT